MNLNKKKRDQISLVSAFFPIFLENIIEYIYSTLCLFGARKGERKRAGKGRKKGRRGKRGKKDADKNYHSFNGGKKLKIK